MIACGPRTLGPASLRISVPKALPLHMRGKVRELTELATKPEHRGQGFARDLMAHVCMSADLGDTWLFLHVEPDGDVDKGRLANFYASFGFAPIQADPLLMIRQSIKDRIRAQ